MKTRIKVVTLNNGNVRYYPQYKTLFWWVGVYRNSIKITSSNIWTYCYSEPDFFGSFNTDVYTFDIRICKEIIDNLHTYDNKVYEQWKANEPKAIEYIKYP